MLDLGFHHKWYGDSGFSMKHAPEHDQRCSLARLWRARVVLEVSQKSSHGIERDTGNSVTVERERIAGHGQAVGQGQRQG